MARQVAITTSDNPYDPITQFDEWFAYDEMKGYHSCALLARLAKTSIDLDSEQTTEKIEDAIDRIISLNCFGDYQKVVREI